MRQSHRSLYTGALLHPCWQLQRNHCLRVVHNRPKPQKLGFTRRPAATRVSSSSEHLPKSYKTQCFRVFLETSSMQNQQQWLSMDPCVYEKCRWEPTWGTEINGRIWGPCTASPGGHHHPDVASSLLGKKPFSPRGSRLFYTSEKKKKKSLLGIIGRNGPGCSTSRLSHEREKI